MAPALTSYYLLMIATGHVPKLQRDSCSLGAPGFPIDEVKQPDPDPLSSERYSCVYWIDHLFDCDPSQHAINDLLNDGSVDQFLWTSYLHWLEALSLVEVCQKE